MLEVRFRGAGGAQTHRETFLELWFQGATQCVTVSKRGWCASAMGPRPKGDALGGNLDVKLPCFVLDRVELWEDDALQAGATGVGVPLPSFSQEGGNTALCVDVVHVEYLGPSESQRKTVFRRKAFATFFASDQERAPLVGTYDVPLVLRPRRLVPLGDAPQKWRWEPQPGDYRPQGKDAVTFKNFTLDRGEAFLTMVRLQKRWSMRAPSIQRVYEAYVRHRESLEKWARGAQWDASSLQGRMRDVPTWFPSRLTPHVPGIMAADLTVAPFLATPQWWAQQVRAVLRKAGVSEEDFTQTWGAGEPRTACVAMRVAKLWACSRMYATDWMTLPLGGFVENDAYLDLRVTGGGDCDDFAMCVFRAFSALQDLLDENTFGEAVRKCALAAQNYVPFLCTGLYHDAPLARPPRPGDAAVPLGVKEFPHAFVVAYPREWVDFWTLKSSSLHKRGAMQPLLGDGTCWTDACMDGGQACEACGFKHVFTELTEVRTRFVQHVCATASERVKDALGVAFTETSGVSKKEGVFHMHDCVVSLLGFSEGAPQWWQFRECARPHKAAGLLGEILERPQDFVLQNAPPLPLGDLALFREVLKLERPVPIFRTSPLKREQMESLAQRFAREVGATGQAGILSVTVATEAFVQRYPSLRITDEALWGEIAACIRTAPSVKVGLVNAFAGTELTLSLY